MPSRQYVENSYYYFILFADGGLQVPVIRTLRYLGITQRTDGSEVLLFVDIDSDAPEKKVVFDPEHAGDVVLDGPALLDRLKRCFEGTLATSS